MSAQGPPGGKAGHGAHGPETGSRPAPSSGEEAWSREPETVATAPGGAAAVPEPTGRGRGGARSLGTDAARGGITFAAAAAIEQGAMLVRAIILARLLSPVEFGIMGMALVAVRAGEAFSQTGFSRALVHKRGDVSAYLDTVWIVQAVRGLLLYATAWMVSPLAAAFFETPGLTGVLRGVALIFILQGLISPGLFMLERELAFRRQVLPSVAGYLTDLILAVTLAVTLESVWAMVYGLLAGKLVYVAGTYLVRPWRPGLRFRMDLAMEFYRYGRHIFRSTVIDWIVTQLDRVLVGRLLGAPALGIYAVAGRLSSFPTAGLTSTVLRVAFPVFSRVQEDRGRLRTGLLRALGTTALIASSIGAGLWAVAPDFVAVFLKERWSAAAPLLRIMSAGGVAMALGFMLRTILAAIGSPEMAARGSYVFLAALAIPIYPATLRWGAPGAAGSVAAASFVSMLFLLHVTARRAGVKRTELLHALLPAAGASLGMVLAVLAVRGSWEGPAGAAVLSVQVITGLAAYPLLALVLDRILGTGLAAALGRSWRESRRRERTGAG